MRSLLALGRALGATASEIRLGDLRTCPTRDTRGPGANAVAQMVALLEQEKKPKSLREVGIGVITLRRLLTAEEVSELLGISKDATWRYVRSGRIPAIHVGRQIRFDENEIREWLKNGGCGLKDRAR